MVLWVDPVVSTSELRIHARGFMSVIVKLLTMNIITCTLPSDTSLSLGFQASIIISSDPTMTTGAGKVFAVSIEACNSHIVRQKAEEVISIDVTSVSLSLSLSLSLYYSQKSLTHKAPSG